MIYWIIFLSRSLPGGGRAAAFVTFPRAGVVD